MILGEKITISFNGAIVALNISCSLSVDTEMIELVPNGKSRRFKNGLIGGTIQANGAVDISNNLLDLQLEGSEVDFEFALDSKLYGGKGYIRNCVYTGKVQEYGTYNVTLTINDEITAL